MNAILLLTLGLFQQPGLPTERHPPLMTQPFSFPGNPPKHQPLTAPERQLEKKTDRSREKSLEIPVEPEPEQDLPIIIIQENPFTGPAKRLEMLQRMVPEPRDQPESAGRPRLRYPPSPKE